MFNDPRDNRCEACAKWLAAYCHVCWEDNEKTHNTCVDEAFDCGAAVAFGLMGMAEAIRDNPALEACPRCFKYAYASTHFGRDEWLCNDCYKRALELLAATGRPSPRK